MFPSWNWNRVSDNNSLLELQPSQFPPWLQDFCVEVLAVTNAIFHVPHASHIAKMCVLDFWFCHENPCITNVDASTCSHSLFVMCYLPFQAPYFKSRFIVPVCSINFIRSSCTFPLFLQCLVKCLAHARVLIKWINAAFISLTVYYNLYSKCSWTFLKGDMLLLKKIALWHFKDPFPAVPTLLTYWACNTFTSSGKFFPHCGILNID